MSNVRKVRNRPRKDGSVSISWRATWLAADGKRQSKNFTKKGDADAYLKRIDAGLAGGSSSMSVEDLARDHYAYFDTLVKQGIREPTTRDGYGSQIDLHLLSDAAFARTKLSDLTTPLAQAFLDNLLPRCGSLDTVRRMRRSLVTWCKFGQRKGWLAANPAQPCKVERQARPDAGDDRLALPSKDQLAAILRAAEAGPSPERDTAAIRILMFSGLRISEFLGLPDDMLSTGSATTTIKIRERLDRKYAILGRVKSGRARRDVPIGPAASRALKSWRMRRGPAKGFMHKDLAGVARRVPGRLFPAPNGDDLWTYDAFIRDCWMPLLERAGLLDRVKDRNGKMRPVLAFYPHALRHVAASLWIEQGLQPKKVQELLGHATLGMTMDLYGHLWRDDAEDAALALESERLITGGK